MKFAWLGEMVRYRLFFSFGLVARAPIIIKKWSQPASLYLLPTNAFNFCILKNRIYPRVSTLCIHSRKDVDTCRAHVRYYVADPIDLNGTLHGRITTSVKKRRRGSRYERIFNLYVKCAYVYKNILYRLMYDLSAFEYYWLKKVASRNSIPSFLFSFIFVRRLLYIHYLLHC